VSALPAPAIALDSIGISALRALFPGFQQLGVPSVFPRAPPAVYPEGSVRRITLIPSVPGSLQAENPFPYVSRRSGGSNYRTCASVGYNSYKGSSISSMGALPREFTKMSVVPDQSSSMLCAPSPGANPAVAGGAQGTLSHPTVTTCWVPPDLSCPHTACTGRVVKHFCIREATFTDLDAHS